MTLELRYERKICLPEYSLESELMSLKTHALSLRERFAPRFVNSIYFDDCDDSCYRSHWDGVGNRFKLRFRWYGGLETYLSGHWELKCRLGSVGYKRNNTMGPLLVRPPTCDDIPTEFGLSNELFRPVIFVRFFRRYFESELMPLRVTIDSDISCASSDFENSPSVASGRLILEYKYPTAAAERLGQELSLNGRFDRFSKYIFGRQTLGL